MHAEIIREAARWIEQADHLLITAGAGMGVDSGLPDFRGNEGFWRAYPPFQKLGLSFYDLANPIWFERDAHQAWGFYGHRFRLYQMTQPHAGFETLRSWAENCGSAFVFTSNVDMHFQKAGFASEQVLECHGSFSHLQCQLPCRSQTWLAGDLDVQVDESSMRATGPLPHCPACGAVSRPNILMFGDGQWLSSNFDRQQANYRRWLNTIQGSESVAIVELGVGTAVPTVRYQSESLARQLPRARLIRINPREADGPAETLSLAGPAEATLKAIDRELH